MSLCYSTIEIRNSVLEPPKQPTVTLGDFVVADGNVEGFMCANEDTNSFGAGDGGIDEVALKHHVMLSQKGNDDDRIFSALTAVGTDAIGEGQFINLAEVVVNIATIHDDLELILIEIDPADAPDVTVKDFFFVVIPYLHHLIASTEEATGKFLFHDSTAAIQSDLEGVVEGIHTSGATIHGGDDLHIIERIHAEFAGEAILDNINNQFGS